jgi:hypothetical protein
MTAEDGIADTLMGRLRLAGADMNRFRFIEGKRGVNVETHIELDKDILQLDQALKMYPETRLLIIDPITAFLGGVDSHKNGEVRGIMKRLSDLAEKHKISLLLISHPKKGDSSPYDSITGSSGFIDACRTAIMCVRIPGDDDKRAMGIHKSNIGIDKYALGYIVKVNQEPGINDIQEITTIDWQGEVDINLDQCMNHRSKDDKKREPKPEFTEAQLEAIEVAGNILKDGDLLVADLEQCLKNGRISKKAWRAVSNKCGLFHYYSRGNSKDKKGYWGLTDQGKARFHSEDKNESSSDDTILITAQKTQFFGGEYGKEPQGTETVCLWD